MRILKQVFQEPLVRFLAIGAAIFFYFSATAETNEVSPEEIRISVSLQDASYIVAQFKQNRRRAPSLEELQAMIDTSVREDILVTEALNLAMDHQDTVIRRRLVQKMTFFVESAARSENLEDGVLISHFDSNKDAYTRAPQLAFEQIFLGDAAQMPEIQSTFDALISGESFEHLGVPSMLPTRTSLSSARTIDGSFGSGFFAALTPLEHGEWSGPIQSGFGMHIVRITAKQPATVPDFADVRDQVEASLRNEQMHNLMDEMYARMRADYVIETPNETALIELIK